MSKKKAGGSLGRAIIKDRFGGGRKKGQDSYLHTSELDDGYDWGRLNLQSVTDQNNLDDFLATAELAGTEFTAEKLNVSIVNTPHHTGLLSAAEERQVKDAQEKHKTLLKIPRRPDWDETTTPDELDRRERDAFLDWRRGLAELQDIEGLLLTPFEKNLQFWRQLWRVIERSDVVVQIVDARNPLLFRCPDLEAYVREKDEKKLNMILINKADYLTEEQRIIWADYFDKQGIKVVFWSAANEMERIKQEAAEALAEEDEANELDEGSDSEDDEATDEDSTNQNVGSIDEGLETDPLRGEQPMESEESERGAESVSGGGTNTTDNRDLGQLEQQCENENSCTSCNAERTTLCEMQAESNSGACATWKNNSNLLTGDELVDLFKSVHHGKKFQEGVTTIGLVGYPNVGKSSTINAILQTKKVPVSATPGRTKHFQTLFVDKTLMLCDCPGLVMPTFVSTKAEMVVSGILPIDQMRDFVPPVSLVCKTIPRHTLMTTYGIMLPTPQEGEDPDRHPTAHELAGAYGYTRGFMTHKGIPDFQRSARFILKDYMNGKLLYCHPPPDAPLETFKPTPELPKTDQQVRQELRAAAAQEQSQFTSHIDKEFFTKKEQRVASKGVQGVVGYTRKDGFTTHHSSDAPPDPADVQRRLQEKPWKKHGNRNKKEKLRRVHKHLNA